MIESDRFQRIEVCSDSCGDSALTSSVRTLIEDGAAVAPRLPIKHGVEVALVLRAMTRR